MIDERPAWMAEGLCNTGDAALLDLFFPRTNHPEYMPAKSARAKQVCARCPVREQCLDYAINHPTRPDGVWGGHDELELAELRRERQTPPRPIDHGTVAGAAQHRRRGERPCPECLRACALDQQFKRPSRARDEVSA